MGGFDTCLTGRVEILRGLGSKRTGCKVEKSVFVLEGDNESTCVSS